MPLDPRAIILAVFSLAVWVSTTTTPGEAVFWVGFLILAFSIVRRSSSAAPSLPGGLWKWAAVMMLATVILHALVIPAAGGRQIVIGPATLSMAGLLMGVHMALRLVAFLLLGAMVLSLCPPLRLAAGLSRLLLPLRKVGVPVETIFYFAFFVLRMFPTLVEEGRVIGLAQRSRGMRIRGLRPASVRAATAVIIPVFAAGLRRGEHLALALAARGFDAHRLPLAVRSLRMRQGDWAVIGALALGWGWWIVRHLSG